MPVKILELGKQFRPKTSVVYPPFKKGRYMEEYVYDYIMEHKDKLDSDHVYIPIFWTNLQIHPGFANQKQNYQTLLSLALSKMPSNTKYFTIVQHDDGIQLDMCGVNILIFGACSGDIPLPLIYEDTDQRLLSMPRIDTKMHLASFIGSNTHPLRSKMKMSLTDKPDIILGIQKVWSASVPKNQADIFIETTLQSKFCLAPRGYGRSSFRFFESILLDVIPVYFWDDKEWLPYKDILDYSKFSVSIHEKDIENTYQILRSISDETYLHMIKELKKVRKYFTLDGMVEYIINKIKL